MNTPTTPDNPNDPQKNLPPSQLPPDNAAEIMRRMRLDALQGDKPTVPSPSTPSAPSDDQPNISAQKILTVLAQIKADAIRSAQSQAEANKWILSTIKEANPRNFLQDLLNIHSGQQHGQISELTEASDKIQTQQATITWRINVGFVSLGVMLLGLVACVAFILGRHA